MTLRGTTPDPNQTTPIGLNGGRLAEAIDALIHEKDGDLCFGDLYMDDILDMIDWASDITVGAPKKSTINSNIPRHCVGPDRPGPAGYELSEKRASCAE